MELVSGVSIECFKRAALALIHVASVIESSVAKGLVRFTTFWLIRFGSPIEFACWQ